MAPFGCAWLGSEDQMARSTEDSVRVIKPGRTYVGKQGITYGAGASAETVGAKRVCMNVMPMPPGAKAKAHYHQGIETIAYMLEGECNVYYGDRLEFRLTARAGDQVYVPRTCRTPPAMKAPRPARGWWCIRPAATRRESSCCRSWTSSSPRNNAALTPRHGRASSRPPLGGRKERRGCPAQCRA